jgi:RHS repeat-associated protein
LGLTETESSTGKYQFHFDGPGNTVLMTDQYQSPSWWRGYDGYGMALAQSNPPSQTNQYDYEGSQGYERVANSNYLLAGVRTYDPETGVFLQQDPLSLGLGDYTYADDDPINEVDPTGLAGIPSEDSVTSNASEAIQDYTEIGDAHPEELRPHGNSLNSPNESHVYRIDKIDPKTGESRLWKVGESGRGTDANGVSRRAGYQVRKLARKTGDIYRSRILKTFPNKAKAVEYQGNVLQRFFRWFRRLPDGNRNFR